MATAKYLELSNEEFLEYLLKKFESPRLTPKTLHNTLVRYINKSTDQFKTVEVLTNFANKYIEENGNTPQIELVQNVVRYAQFVLIKESMR